MPEGGDNNKNEGAGADQDENEDASSQDASLKPCSPASMNGDRLQPRQGFPILFLGVAMY